ncbi:hypothetical protein GW756_03245 [bacterium]|nr:hypothetical protein [bacterium]NCQ55467.1 hypothetical protein [Candidatus Parcubacteria bacterium]NCS67829.1 hypothetical protein [Candidatus Peregrinibacteria bacterium]NCS96357.1 hypothetical protein [bacterium]
MWKNLVLTLIVLVLCGFILYVTVFQLDPMGEQKYVAFLSLGASGLFGLWSFFTLIFFFGAELISGYKLGNRSFVIAVRRGFLISGLGMSLITLQFLNLLGWPEAILLALFFGLMEWIFLTGRYY